MLMNISLEPIADFCPFLGYWPSKSGSHDHDVKGEFVSLAESMVFGTVGKIIPFRLFLPKQTMAEVLHQDL